MLDPTREEMIEFLKEFGTMHAMEELEFSMEEAIYWFSHDYHGGQSSNLYNTLSTSQFRPGPLTNKPSEGDSSILYEYLTYEYTLPKE